MHEKLLPSPFNCPFCGYDLSSSPVWTCSECGYLCTAEDVVRGGCRRTFRALARRHAAVATGVVASSGLFVLFIARRSSDAVVGTLVLTGLVLCSALAGLWMAQAASRPERVGWRIAWFRAQVWLHLPWASVAIVGAALRIVDAIDGGRGSQILPFAGLAWVGLLIVSPAAAIYEWQRMRRLYVLKHRTPIVYFPIAAFLVFAAAFLCAGWLAILDSR